MAAETVPTATLTDDEDRAKDTQLESTASAHSMSVG